MCMCIYVMDVYFMYKKFIQIQYTDNYSQTHM